MEDQQGKNTSSGLYTWWPTLLGPLVMTFVYVVYLAKPDGFSEGSIKKVLELFAVIILPVISLCFLLCAVVTHRRIVIMLTALAIAFYFREQRDLFLWAEKGIYVALAGLGIWAYFWRVKLAEDLREFPILKIWLFSTFWTYFLSQLIARRALQDVLPHEDQVNVALEEAVETMAHLMFLVMGLIAWLYNSKKSKKVKSNQENSSKKKA